MGTAGSWRKRLTPTTRVLAVSDGCLRAFNEGGRNRNDSRPETQDRKLTSRYVTRPQVRFTNLCDTIRTRDRPARSDEWPGAGSLVLREQQYTYVSAGCVIRGV